MRAAADLCWRAPVWLALVRIAAAVQVEAEVSAGGTIALSQDEPQMRASGEEQSIMMAALQDQDKEIKGLKNTLSSDEEKIGELRGEEQTHKTQIKVASQKKQIQKLEAELHERDGEIKSLFDDLTTATESNGPHLAAVLLTGADLKDKATWMNFHDRVVQARQTWAKDLSMTAVSGDSLFFREILAKSGCTNGTEAQSSRTQASFHEWTCKGDDFAPFKVVQTPCDEDGVEAQDCKWGAAIDYMMYARPKDFEKTDWFEIGSDDMGLAKPLLSDLLRHYDSKEKIALNPSARTLDTQRSGTGQRASHDVDYCNHAIPQLFSGSVMSRGLLNAAKADLADGALSKLSHNFRNAHYDSSLGLVFWRYAAKFLPMEGNAGGLTEDRWPRVTDVMLAPNLRDKAAFEHFDAEVQRRLPAPEELPGVTYADSPHARQKLPLQDLKRTNCRGETRRDAYAVFDTPQPLEWFVKQYGGSVDEPPKEWLKGSCAEQFKVRVQRARDQMQGLMISKPTGDEEFFQVTGVRPGSRVRELDLREGDRIAQVETSQGTFHGPEMRQAVGKELASKSDCEQGQCAIVLSVERSC